MYGHMARLYSHLYFRNWSFFVMFSLFFNSETYPRWFYTISRGIFFLPKRSERVTTFASLLKNSDFQPKKWNLFRYTQ